MHDVTHKLSRRLSNYLSYKDSAEHAQIVAVAVFSVEGCQRHTGADRTRNVIVLNQKPSSNARRQSRIMEALLNLLLPTAVRATAVQCYIPCPHRAPQNCQTKPLQDIHSVTAKGPQLPQPRIPEHGAAPAAPPKLKVQGQEFLAVPFPALQASKNCSVTTRLSFRLLYC